MLKKISTKKIKFLRDQLGNEKYSDIIRINRGCSFLRMFLKKVSLLKIELRTIFNI
jgi:hypothetical protein